MCRMREITWTLKPAAGHQDQIINLIGQSPRGTKITSIEFHQVLNIIIFNILASSALLASALRNYARQTCRAHKQTVEVTPMGSLLHLYQADTSARPHRIADSSAHISGSQNSLTNNATPSKRTPMLVLFTCCDLDG